LKFFGRQIYNKPFIKIELTMLSDVLLDELLTCAKDKIKIDLTCVMGGERYNFIGTTVRYWDWADRKATLTSDYCERVKAINKIGSIKIWRKR